MARYSFNFVYGVLGMIQVFYLVLIIAPPEISIIVPTFSWGLYTD